MRTHPRVAQARKMAPQARYTQGLCAAFALALWERNESLKVAVLYDLMGLAFHVVCVDAMGRVIDVMGRKTPRQTVVEYGVALLEFIKASDIIVSEKDIQTAGRYIDRQWSKSKGSFLKGSK